MSRFLNVKGKNFYKKGGEEGGWIMHTYRRTKIWVDAAKHNF